MEKTTNIISFSENKEEIKREKCFKLKEKIVLNTKTQITYYEVNGKIYSEAFPKRNIVALTQIILLTLLSLQ